MRLAVAGHGSFPLSRFTRSDKTTRGFALSETPLQILEMPEVWLRTNRRALALAMVLVGLLLAVTLAAIPLGILLGGVPAGSQAMFAASMVIISAVPAWLLIQLGRAM